MSKTPYQLTDGPWAGKTLWAAPGDHESRVVTQYNAADHGLKASQSFQGVYEWDGSGWKFKAGMQLVGDR
jgi:hypothetical protein